MDLSQVTLTQIRYAIAVYDAQNFRQAAQACHVSQSGLSMQIQKLEDLLCLILFDRKKKPVLPTEEGRDAFLQMRRILGEVERLGQIASEGTEPAGRFRLGVIPTLSSTVMPLFLADFVSKYPRVELIVEELKTEVMIAELQANTLDAGLAATPLAVPGLKETPLGRERMHAYLPPADPLLEKPTVSQRQLLARKLWMLPEGHCFRSQVLSYCGTSANEESPLKSPVQFESGSFETLMALVDEDMGATIIPDLVAKRLDGERGLRVRALTTPVPVREIGLITARLDLRRRVTAVLAQSLSEALAQALDPVSRRAAVLNPV